MEKPLDASTSYHYYGGQLKKLRKALTDPFEQSTEIVLLGDSITFGTGLPFASRTITPSALATNFASKSWANEFKRYLGRTFFDGSEPNFLILPISSTNTFAVEYRRKIRLLPMCPPFRMSTDRGGFFYDYIQSPDSECGFSFELVKHKSASHGEFSLAFDFTGRAFTLEGISQTIEGGALSYDLYANDEYFGNHTFQTTPTPVKVDKHHEFPDCRRKTITIKVKAAKCKGKGLKLSVAGISFDKTLRIINHSIRGASVEMFNRLGFSEEHPACITPSTGFVFIQLGTNDRIASVKRGQPIGMSTFLSNLHVLYNNIGNFREQIYLCGPPATKNAQPVYYTNMAGIRSMIETFAITKDLDFIDNYTAFSDIDLGKVLLDGIHPNEVGHSIIFNNVKRALELAR